MVNENYPEEGAACEKSQKELDEEIKKKKERQVNIFIHWSGSWSLGLWNSGILWLFGGQDI